MSRANAKLMASVINSPGNVMICGNCRGKGFSPDVKKARAHRKCQTCRGLGGISVGSTKR